ncbi:MAG: hypothetical protein F4073_08195 [Rhodobacteraceae bacterium]|nr:hypothetical protein [Paracoccaceae bacterium]MYF45607.1 hypothetical protein [Paracoccaceae bacterium]MYI91919.1 hypothetical protein [Paracoccaceae bacterium]
MKKANAKDLKKATTKKTGTRKQSKRKVEGTLKLGPNISESIAENPDTSGTKKTKAGSGKPRGIVSKIVNQKNGPTKTKRKASTRTKRASIPERSGENLVLDEWNSKAMDDQVDKVYENPVEQFASQEQKQKRNKVKDKLMQEIQPGKNPENKDDKQTSSSLQEEDCMNDKASTNLFSSLSPVVKWSKPTGFSLVGKPWVIKIMFALIILIVFLLANHFVFTENAPQKALQYFSIVTEEDQRLNHIYTPDISETIADDSAGMNSREQTDVITNIITETRVSRIGNEKPFQETVESKPDLEISRQELAFWQNLAKTSFEEIAEIRTNLAKYQNSTPTDHDISKGILGNTELDSVNRELSQPEGGFIQDEAHQETSMMKKEIIKSRGLVDETGKNQYLNVKIGMEEDISLPNPWEFGESIGDIDSDQPMTENLSTVPEGGELEARLQSIIVQIETLNTTTKDILSVLREARSVLDIHDMHPEQDFSARSIQQVLIPHIEANMVEKFRITGFPGMSSAKNGDSSVIVDSNRKGMADKLDMNVSFMRNLRKGFEGESTVKQNGVQNFPLLKFASDENLVIRSLSEKDMGYDHMKGVTLGEEIPGFGLVLNIKEDEKGRMIVMENGILYLN